MGESAHANRSPAPAPETRRGGVDPQAIRGAVPQELSGPQASLLYRLGLLLVAFLLKPLLSRAIRPDPKRALAKSEAPLLFILVRKIAEAAGAPVPDRIEIDCDVNASAGRLPGEDGKKLVLTIGLPLVAGLELRQLAGVLAHEFGHFSQGAGMRLSSKIRGMNFWFYRLVYERDSFDEHLASARAEENVVALVAGLASLGVWVSRGVLWLMMQIGHAISCSFMRQMEFDADRYEIALAGSDTFTATARDLGLLNYATQLAFGELEEAWREGRLGDDLPLLISTKARALPAEAKEAVERQILSLTTGVFDTHPCDRDRIVRAQRAECSGSFDLDAPAAVAFSDFDALCRELTLEYYEDALGPEVRGTTLVSTSDLMEHRDRLSAEEDLVDRYFPRLIPWARPFALPGDGVPRPDRPKEIAARLKTLRAEIGSRFDAAGEAYARYLREDERELDGSSADALLSAGVKPDPKAFHLPTPDERGVARARERAIRLRDEAAPELGEFEALESERLLCALSLLRHPKVKERLGDAAMPDDEVAELVTALAGINASIGAVRTLYEERLRLATLFANAEGREEDSVFVSAVHEQAERVSAVLGPLVAQLSEVPFPFEHGKDRLCVAEQVLPEGLPPDHVGAIGQAAALVVQRIIPLHTRIVARLVAAAEPVEQVLGLAQRPKQGSGG